MNRADRGPPSASRGVERVGQPTLEPVSFAGRVRPSHALRTFSAQVPCGPGLTARDEEVFMERTQHARQALEATREEAEHWHLIRDVVVPGALAGMLGAGVMAALALPLGALTRGDPWFAARLAGGVFFREAPSGTLSVLVGLGVHLAMAGGLATLFAMVLPRGGTGVAALMLGVLMGLVLQVVMTSLIIPFASPPLDREAPHGALLLLHLAFGASLGAVVPARVLVMALDRMRRAVRGARHAPS